MICGALQSAYLPWLGFFDQVNRCDLFIIYDDLDYTKRDWRNRNRIKTPDGPRWLTVPVRHCKIAEHKKINEIEIHNIEKWQQKHWKTLWMNYAQAPFFPLYRDFFHEVFFTPWKYLADLNRTLIDYFIGQLSIKTRVIYSSDAAIERDYKKEYGSHADPTCRIVYLCRRFGASEFLEGDAGANYIRMDQLKSEAVNLRYHRYIHPTYRQQFGDFVPYLSIIDLLFNHGPASLAILSTSNSRN